MRLHLINDQPRSTERPKLGLGYISSYLRKYCDDIDISVSFQGDDTVGTIGRIKPDIIGLTATTETFNNVIRTGKEIKDAYNLPVVIGGTHITILPQHLPRWIDAGVIGEGERTLLELIEAYRKTGVLTDENIRGIIFWDGEHQRRTEVRELIDPLDSIPFPDWDMLGLSKEGPGHILTSRGCTFRCVFCASSAIWRKIRFFSPEYVVKEIKTIVERFGRKEVLIYDDLFTADRNRVRRISELICMEGLDKVVRFECLSNVNHFNPDTASDLKKMNVHRISFGMESGSPPILKYLKKGTVTVEKIRSAVKAGVDNGMEVLGSFIIGCPGETEDDLMMTHDFIKGLKLTEIGVNVATPFPGTELWDYAVASGHIKDEWDDSMYAMKTITPETIKDKRLLCPMEKDRFIRIYKMLIDLDSMLIDRRVRTRTLKERAIECFEKGVHRGKRLRILDTSCEDGALGAAIKARIDAEVTGLYPEADYVTDCERRLDKVLRGGIEELVAGYPEGHFDLIIFNEVIPDDKAMKAYLRLLGENGVIAGAFANRAHYSYLAYSLYGINRPFFETTDGTVQYMRWGAPDKEKNPGYTMKEIKSFMAGAGCTLLSTYDLKGLDTQITKNLGRYLGEFVPGPDNIAEELRTIRHFFTARKTPVPDGSESASGSRVSDTLRVSPENRPDKTVTCDCLDLVPLHAKKILDVGCGAGLLGKRLLAKGAEEVVGVDIDPSACEEARRNLSRVICCDAGGAGLPFEKGYFDCIVLSGILDHLRDPQSALKKLREYLSDSGTVVASIPNTRYFETINMLVEGRWGPAGPGSAPLRFFTKKGMELLFTGAGFEVTGIGAGPVHSRYYELGGSVPENISFGRVVLKGLAPEEVMDLFVERYLIRADKTGSEFNRLDDHVSSCVNSGNLEKAESILEEYLEAHPADVNALHSHAEVCCRLSLFDKASESLERVLLFDPDRQDIFELKERIHKLHAG